MRAEAHVHIGRARKGLADCISTRDLPTGRTRHAAYLHLTDALFAVQPAGLRRFRESGQKNVHAFVRGTNVTESPTVAGTPRDWELERLGYREALYNPMKNDTFIDKAEGFPVHRAQTAILVGKRVFYRLHAS